TCTSSVVSPSPPRWLHRSLFTAPHSRHSLVGSIYSSCAISFIDQLEARATRQAPPIRVHNAGHAAHYILLLSRVLLSLASYLPRMPLERRGTQDWLRPGGPTCLRPNPTPHHTTPHCWKVVTSIIGTYPTDF
uniref:HSL_N domain-containing protein n=1 Tax=Mesocestoides corti TaxID=53468 RepID=A0A5K3FQL6_MESCO